MIKTGEKGTENFNIISMTEYGECCKTLQEEEKGTHDISMIDKKEYYKTLPTEIRAEHEINIYQPDKIKPITVK